MMKRSLVSLLRECKLATTKEGIMVKLSEVYDHNNRIFLAAFRFQATDRFLSKDIKRFHSFWREVGLHCQTNGKLLGRDYMVCLYAILKRLEG